MSIATVRKVKVIISLKKLEWINVSIGNNNIPNAVERRYKILTSWYTNYVINKLSDIHLNCVYEHEQMI